MRGAPARQSRRNGLQQTLQRDRLFQEIHGANARGLDRRIDGGVAAPDDHAHVAQALRTPLFQQTYAIGGGHPDVQQHQIRTHAKASGARLRRVFGQFDRVSFVHPPLA
ncbi:hypothetical protein G6F32_016828 [Rhizopus arrhizus]|nr:hypothetical protein G6F32_016828 [Rhizopus arrhizus]